jgi:hypothetical protein
LRLEDQRSYAALSVDAILVKPIKSELLVEAIESAFAAVKLCHAYHHTTDLPKYLDTTSLSWRRLE